LAPEKDTPPVGYEASLICMVPGRKLGRKPGRKIVSLEEPWMSAF